MSDWKNVQYKDGKMRTSEGGGGGGSSTFAGLEDVDFSNLQNGQVPKYNSTTQKWENANESGGGGYAHHYSTTEQVIGTWIDGKPLYERVFETNYVPVRDNWVDTGIDATGMDKIISFIGHCYGIGYMFLTSFDEVQLYNNMVRITCGPNGAGRTYNLSILKYTKTTD